MDANTILLVTACDAERSLLTYLLQSKGLPTREAPSARQALEHLRAGGIGLIVADAALWCRPTSGDSPRETVAAELPVVILEPSAGDESELPACLGRIAARVPRRGFDVADLLGQVQSALSGRTADPGAAPAAPVVVNSAAGQTLVPLSEAVVGEALDRLGHVPAFDFNLTDLITTTCAKNEAVRHISEIVYRDPMLVLALLRAANAVPGTRAAEPILNPVKALERVGVRDYYRLAESVGTIDLAKHADWDLSHFWLHSVATARVAGLLARRLQLNVVADAMCAGLLHDLGFFVLAQFFPDHFAALRHAGATCSDPDARWERSIIGADHGQIAAWTFKHFGLPGALQNVALAHQHGRATDHSMARSSRLLTIIVQAADRIVDALFPGAVVLTTVADLAPEFEIALVKAGVEYEVLIDESRCLVADLLAEMIYLFRDAADSSCFTRRNPVERLLYHNPEPRRVDLLRLYLDIHSREFHELSGLDTLEEAGNAPLVLNLTNVSNRADQAATLTALRTDGFLKGRRGLVLLAHPGAAHLEQLIPPDWSVATLPLHSAQLLPELATTTTKAPAPLARSA